MDGEAITGRKHVFEEGYLAVREKIHDIKRLLDPV